MQEKKGNRISEDGELEAVERVFQLEAIHWLL